MTQTFDLPDLNSSAAGAIATMLPAALQSLRSLFSGDTAPASPVAGQPWADTSTGNLMVRNASNTAWLKVCSLNASNVVQLSVENWFVASLSATRSGKLGVCPRAGTVKRLVLLCDTASTSSSGNEWRAMLRKRTNATPGTAVDLFSGNVGTFTALVGVRSPATEFVAHQAMVFTPNQNASVADLDVLELEMTRLGTGTTLANFRAFVEID
jgi:hypothetical protein